jgi:uncharacterized membrane protein
MKPSIALLAVAIAFLLSATALAATDYVEYSINIQEDGSAHWTVIHVTDIDTVVGSWEDFEHRLISTINNAKDRTGREMAPDLLSLEMSTQIHWETSSKTIMYIFRWENFSIIEESQISIGDVFTEDFFSLLFGEGELILTYPPGYLLRSVSINPNEMDQSTNTLHWYRTQDFLAGNHNILFEAGGGSNGFLNLLFTLAILSSGGIGIMVITFLVFKQRRKQKEKLSRLDEFPSLQESESDQDKILRLLESSGGNLKQSEVSVKLGFSRAKTSLLLSEMEKNSIVRRIKKGKTKIIFRVESKEGTSI